MNLSFERHSPSATKASSLFLASLHSYLFECCVERSLSSWIASFVSECPILRKSTRLSFDHRPVGEDQQSASEPQSLSFVSCVKRLKPKVLYFPLDNVSVLYYDAAEVCC